jgi:hypothetical protein
MKAPSRQRPVRPEYKQKQEISEMRFVVLLTGLIAISGTGCMSGYTTVHHQRAVYVDSTLPAPLSIEEIIAMAQDSVSDEVIISQIKSTGSTYRLNTRDILQLKKEGVSQNVIAAMIKAADDHKPAPRALAYYPVYDPDFGYFWYPYYYWGPTFRVGLRFSSPWHGARAMGFYRPIRVRR